MSKKVNIFNAGKRNFIVFVDGAEETLRPNKSANVDKACADKLQAMYPVEVVDAGSVVVNGSSDNGDQVKELTAANEALKAEIAEREAVIEAANEKIKKLETELEAATKPAKK